MSTILDLSVAQTMPRFSKIAVARLRTSLDAANAWVGARCSWSTDDPPADLVQAVAMLTDRLLARESSPDGFVGMQESGPVYIGRVDRDIESLIAPHRRAVFA